MKLLLTTGSGFIHWAVRIFTWSQWSHIAVIAGDTVIESVSGHGVREIPIQQAIAEATKHSVVEIPIFDEETFLWLLRSQIGKPYDYAAIFGFMFRRNWQEERKWFCSELPAWAAILSGSPVFRIEAMHRITPENWWMLADRK